MDPKTIAIGGLSAATIAAIAIGLLSRPQFDEMAAEVDRVRSAHAKAKDEAGQYLEVVPTELGKAINEVGLASKRMVAWRPCKIDKGRAFCTLEGGNEVQFNAVQSAKVSPEIAALDAECDAKEAAAEAESVKEVP